MQFGQISIRLILISKGSASYNLIYDGNCTMISDENGNWRIKFLTDRILTLSENVCIDAFLVGDGSDGGAGGRGQGTTTREFGESTGTLYAGGAVGYFAESGAGGGAGGPAGSGGSGIVVIRNAR